MNWDDQRTFLAVLEAGSYSAAARLLGVTQPTVRARVEALESALATILFTRSANGLTPTEQARSLRASVMAMAHASDAFVRGASEGIDVAAGVVRVSVSEFVGVEVIPPMLARLGEKYPGIAIELDLSNAGADLLEQQVDLAVRMFPPRQNALVAKKVGAIPIGLYAHKDYLARMGMPVSADELAGHRIIGPDRNLADLANVEALFPMVERASFVLRTDSHPAVLSAVRAAIGIGAVQRNAGDADGRLERVLPDVDIASLDTWIVTHENLRQVVRVRAVFDHLVDEFVGLDRGTQRPGSGR